MGGGVPHWSRALPFPTNEQNLSYTKYICFLHDIIDLAQTSLAFLTFSLHCLVTSSTLAHCTSFCFPCATPNSFYPLLRSNIFPEISLNPYRNQRQLVPPLCSLCLIKAKSHLYFISQSLFWPYFPIKVEVPKVQTMPFIHHHGLYKSKRMY